ncbi:MAG TPA: hypothetical protein VHG52_11175 [Thermomicrobiales bacterium]|nr:hypothetical protein [Thermomicrobiales bacterium]
MPRSARAYVGEFRSRVAMQSNQLHDPFSVNPIRRSLVAGLVSLALITTPFLISEEVGATVMLSFGWIAMAVLVFCIPIFLWSVAEELIRVISNRLYPPVNELDLPERVIHILQRHGVRTVRAAEQLDPAAFHLMANMGPRDAEAVVRAINLWRYRRWQEAGFPAGGD